jgi:VWFA-related protein
MQLDVVVTDKAGHPVSGLQQKDFTVLDNRKPEPILSFREVNGTTGNGTASDPPVEVILLINATNNSLTNVAYERYQIEKFLRQNGGHLAQPVTLAIFAEQGTKVSPAPSTDGNQLAQTLDKYESTMHVVRRGGGYDAIERLELSMKTLQQIAEAEGGKPGRKMLIWIGPGVPMLEGPGYEQFSDRTQREVFNIIVATTEALRDARITMYSVNPAEPGSGAQIRADFYTSYLKAVASPHQAQSGNLAVPVFAVHSGGRVYNTPGDLVRQLNDCIADAEVYYTVGYDSPGAEHTDEYHSVEVKVDKPGLKARTNAGYYAEPGVKP